VAYQILLHVSCKLVCRRSDSTKEITRLPRRG
jgi:hypothetical protein